MARDPLLQVSGLRAGYRGVAVVNGVDLAVSAGEVVVLLGPNGAGKTTTLQTLSGFLRPIGGTIRFAGERIDGMAPQRLARAGLAYVPDDRALLRNLTVRENLSLVRPPQFDALDLFPELGRLLDRRAGLLSGGEQQMLALARSLIAGPKLLLVDELSLGLAPVLVERLLTRLRTSADELGLGVFLVEQHVQQALAMADRAYVMAHGSIELEASAADLRDRREELAERYLGLAPA